MSRSQAPRLPTDLRWLCPVTGCGDHKARKDEVQRHCRTFHADIYDQLTVDGTANGRFNKDALTTKTRAELENVDQAEPDVNDSDQRQTLDQTNEDDDEDFSYTEFLNSNLDTSIPIPYIYQDDVQPLLQDPSGPQLGSSDLTTQQLAEYLTSILPEEFGGGSANTGLLDVRAVLENAIAFTTQVNEERAFTEAATRWRQELAAPEAAQEAAGHTSTVLADRDEDETEGAGGN